MEVWKYIKKPRMLLNQRFVAFPMNIIYTAFYTGSANTGYINIYTFRAYRLVCKKPCILLNVVSLYFSGATPFCSIFFEVF